MKRLCISIGGFLTLTLAALVASSAPGDECRRDAPEQSAVKGAVLAGLPHGFSGARVISDGCTVTVDLLSSRPLERGDLTDGDSDRIVHAVIDSLRAFDFERFVVRAEGADGQVRAVSDYLPERDVQPTAVSAQVDHRAELLGHGAKGGHPPVLSTARPTGALSGKTVWLSPGHGWLYYDTLSAWSTQRGNLYGVVEDFSNAETVGYYLYRYLWNAGAEVGMVRERCMNENEVVVDDEDGAPDYVETGTWEQSVQTGYDGGSYRYAWSESPGTATATWTPDLPADGYYGVWVWYLHGTNRPDAVTYEVHHGGGVTEVSLSQEVHGESWYFLGEFWFAAGTGGKVVLSNGSADTGEAVIADAVRFGGGIGDIPDAVGGVSGEPRWEEAALYYAEFQGYTPPYGDVTARPLYAEHELAKGYSGESDDAVYLSWHSNCCSATGTESYIHDTAPTAGSADLQSFVHAEIIDDLRAQWDSTWVDRGQKSGNYGEIRELSTMPGVLVEVAFHDTEDPGDADDLKQPEFRRIAARAAAQGIIKYFADKDGTAVALPPEPPTAVRAENTGAGQITVSWEAPIQETGDGDPPDGYVVYTSENGKGFDDGTTISSGTSFALDGLDPETLRYFRVASANSGGVSFPSAVVAAATPASGVAADVLVVDGFDRADRYTLVYQDDGPTLGTTRRMFLERMNNFDYVVEHAGALAECGYGVDSAADEAVDELFVDLGSYPGVDWFVGNESTTLESFTSQSRDLIATYAGAHGAYLVSGSEIGWHLVDTGDDPTFFESYLKASYDGDDSEAYEFSGVDGGVFDGITGTYGESEVYGYDVFYPDRLGATGGSQVLVSYVGGTGDGAAVGYAGTDFSVVYFGFPLETIPDGQARRDLICGAMEFMGVEPTPPAEEDGGVDGDADTDEDADTDTDADTDADGDGGTEGSGTSGCDCRIGAGAGESASWLELLVGVMIGL